MTSLDIKHINKKNGNGNLLAAIAIIVLGLSLGLCQLNTFPAYTHAWAQGDWYALAIGFHNNGYDLFHPESLIYNKQFPGWWKEASDNTVTSVDFPLHEYIVALLMALFDTTAPWVFRVWTLLCSLTGMFFLYLLARRLTHSTLKALLVAAVAMTSPVYAYYFTSYLPSAPALALVMAGLWAYVAYWQRGRIGHWHLAIALLALATLTRTSQAVALVAVCAFEVLRILRGEVKVGLRWLSPLVAAVSIGGYMLWNAHLRATCGSLFRNNLMPAHSLEDAHGILQYIQEKWRYEYFSRLQHWMVAIAVVAALVYKALRVKRHPDAGSGRGRRLSLVVLLLIWVFGEVCFMVAMIVQFHDHDYYFLDSMYMPVLFTLTLALAALPNLRKPMPAIAFAVLLVALGWIMARTAGHGIAGRCNADDRAQECSRAYEGADRWLDNIGVSRDARILSVFSYPQNSPFILMGRRGYSLMWYDTDIVESAMRFPFDYIIVEDHVFADNLPWQPDLLGRLVRLDGNGRLSLCALSDTIVNQTPEDFFK